MKKRTDKKWTMGDIPPFQVVDEPPLAYSVRGGFINNSTFAPLNALQNAAISYYYLIKTLNNPLTASNAFNEFVRE